LRYDISSYPLAGLYIWLWLPRHDAAVGIGAFIAAAMLIAFDVARGSRYYDVWLDDGALWIRRWGRATRIPFSAILSVDPEQTGKIQLPRIVVCYRISGPTVQSARFIPRGVLRRGTTDAAATTLNAAIALP
jgi:hypothetical protein